MRDGCDQEEEEEGGGALAAASSTSSSTCSSRDSSRGSSSSRDTVLSCSGRESYVAGSWHPHYLDSSSGSLDQPDPPFLPGQLHVPNSCFFIV
jgi:hypothetical protein